MRNDAKSLGAGAHLPAIQGVRAVAVALVVSFHAWPGAVPGGFVGVDVFFVISGFLITRLLLRELRQAGRIDYLQFYSRRIRRLLPALTVVVAAVLAASWLLEAPLERKMLTSSAVASLVYLSNFWFAHQATDYLADGAHSNPLLHTWSLSVEEQFYLVWPVLLAFAWRSWRRGAGCPRLAYALAGASLLSFALCLALVGISRPWAFFGSPNRAWEFGVGALLALRVGGARDVGKAAMALQWAALVAVLSTGLLYSSATSYPGWATLLPVGATGLLLAGVEAGTPGALPRLLSTWPLRWLGDLSYSWYLWHWPVLTVTRELLGYSSGGAILAAVLLSLALAWVTHVLVENPIRFSRRLAGRPAFSLLVAATMTLSLLALTFQVRVSSAKALAGSDQARYEQAGRDLPDVYRKGCHAPYFEEKPVPCEAGGARADRVVVLFGDSHAAQWAPALESIAIDHGWKMVSLTKSACPAPLYEPTDPNLGRAYVECTRWRERALALMRELKPALVVISSSRKYPALVDSGPAGIEEWNRGVDALLVQLGQFAQRVMIIKDTPRPGFDVPACLARARWRGIPADSACAFEPRGASSSVVDRMWSLGVSLPGRVQIYDPTSLICPESPCTTERGGVVLYSDSHHLTATFSRTLAGALSKAMESVAPARRSIAASPEWPTKER